MLTGRANYEAYGEKLNFDLLGDPDLAMDPDYATAIAAQFWVDHGLNILADDDDIVSITKRVNGGLNGLTEREMYLARAKAYIVTARP